MNDSKKNYNTNYTLIFTFCLLGYKVITVLINAHKCFQTYISIPCNKTNLCFIHKLYYKLLF